MSGFGQNSVQTKNGTYTVSIRALNSRYLDIKLSGVDGYPELDHSIRGEIKEKLERGSIQLSINLEFGINGKNEIQFNRERFEKIDKILLKIQKNYGRHMNIADVISSKDLFMDDSVTEVDEPAILDSIKKALTQVDTMRIKEGEKTANHLVSLLEEIAELIWRLKEKSKSIYQYKIQKYREKIKLLTDELDVDENRLNIEIGILADKTDVSEEISRSLSHVDQFKHLMTLDEPVGKRMNFLTQELNREINTLGVKSSDADISKDVIELKSKVEKIREQIQNIL